MSLWVFQLFAISIDTPPLYNWSAHKNLNLPLLLYTLPQKDAQDRGLKPVCSPPQTQKIILIKIVRIQKKKIVRIPNNTHTVQEAVWSCRATLKVLYLPCLNYCQNYGQELRKH